MNKRPTAFQAFISELKRRRVVRVALIYGAAAYAGLEAADLVIPALRAPEWVLSLLVITVLVGFPITVVLSWLFDITPQGIVRTRSESSGPAPTWFSAASIAVLGGIVIAVGAGWWLTNVTGAVAPQGTGAEAIRSIAVLPFDNVSEREEDDYFTDGLGDELRALLSRIGGRDVAARASSFQAREQAYDLQTIADGLGVSAVLRGTVLKEDDRIRVAAELVSVDEDVLQLWNGEYDRVVDDIFEVQTEIAHAIVDALDMRLPQSQAVPMDEVAATNAMAYDKYLWGQFNANRRTAAGVRDAIDNFTMSTGFDSTYSPAWTGLAESHAQELELSELSDPSATIAVGLEAAQRAFDLDPTSVTARTALALFRYQSFDWAAAERELRSALAVDPSSSPALLRYAKVLTATGRTEQAVAQIRAAGRVDGLSPRVRQTAARVLASSGRVEEAIREAQQALQLAPDQTGTWEDIGFMFLAAGRFGDARNAFQRLAEMTSGDAGSMDEFVRAAEVYLTTGERGRVPDGVRAAIEGRPGPAALYHAAVGEVQEALMSLTAAVEQRAYDLATLLTLPTLDPVRGDQAFRSLTVRMGLAGSAANERP